MSTTTQVEVHARGRFREAPALCLSEIHGFGDTHTKRI